MSIYNEDELQAPSWIDQNFLETILQEYENHKDLKVLDYNLSPACMKGDHYASVMFRCKVNYLKSNQSKQKSLIIKTIPMEEGVKRDMLMTTKLFETEIEMYSKTLPKIEKILAEYGEKTKLSADLIYHSLNPHKVIILEDLCESGYDTIRERYLSENEVKAVFNKIAKLHAISYKLGQSNDHEYVTKYQDGLFSSTAIMSNDMITNGSLKFMETLNSHKEFKIFEEKLKILQPEVIQKCKDLYKSYKNQDKQPEAIYVLNHGDFHMKNLMFKFTTDQKLDDLIMVDYQISCYAPSNIDLIYSQYMLLSPELRLRRNEFMQYYFEEFLRILKKIEFKGSMPRYSDFQIANLKYRHFSIFLFSTFLPMVIHFMISSAKDLKDYDAAKIMENTEKVFSEIYRNPNFIQEIRQFMPVLLKEGYLD